MTFGERLREIRKAQKVSQRALAEHVGVNFTYISKIELGYMPPPGEETLTKIVLFLDAPELFSLAGKVPDKLRLMTKASPQLAELVFVLSVKPLPDEIYQKLIALAREENE